MPDDVKSFLGVVERQPAMAPPTAGAPPDTTNPLYGVHGWLKFFVVINLYIRPVLFGLGQIFVWIGSFMLAEDHPGILLTSLIGTGVGLYIVIRGIQVAMGLRDIRPRAVQNAKAFLTLLLAWAFVSVPISFLSGLGAEALLPGILKGVFGGVIGFAIWYSYFNVSKRVRATYPDWKYESQPTKADEPVVTLREPAANIPPGDLALYLPDTETTGKFISTDDLLAALDSEDIDPATEIRCWGGTRALTAGRVREVLIGGGQPSLRRLFGLPADFVESEKQGGVCRKFDQHADS